MILDIMDPVIKTMERAQLVTSNCWDTISNITNLTALLTEMHEQLSPVLGVHELEKLSLFPRVLEHQNELCENKFCGVELLDGWLVVPVANTKQFTWVCREFKEVMDEIKKFLWNLKEAIEKR